MLYQLACLKVWRRKLLSCSCFSEALDSPLGHFLSVGLGLVFLGTRDAADGALCAVAALPHAAFSAAAMRIIEGLAAAGSGDVLKVQRMLGVCAESRPEWYWRKKQKELHSEQQLQDDDSPDSAASTETAGAAGTDGSATASTGGRAAGAGPGANTAQANAANTTAVDDDEDHPDDTDQAVAVLNIALIAFAEEIGAEMALRLYVRFT